MSKALLFDLNGTVIDILTDESGDDIYRTVANFLSYSGVIISPGELKRLYFELNRKQRHDSSEAYPEFDAGMIFQEIICRFQRRKLTGIKTLAEQAARVFRAATRFKLQLYPGVVEVLIGLQTKYRMAALSDGQSLWAVPELECVGLETFFEFVLVSGDFGFRKPDARFFNKALKKFKLAADEVIFVGNDMYRDIYGAHQVGMKTVFFKSNQGDHEWHGVDADYIIYDFNELPRAIEFLEKRG